MIKYSVEKSKTKTSWIIWKQIEAGHGYGVFPIYRGRTRKECYEKLKDIKSGKYEINIKRDVIDNELYFNKEMKIK